MTFHQLASASDWPCREGHLLQLIRSTVQIWVVSRPQYGISAPVPQTSSCGETSGGVAKCRPFYVAVTTILTSPPFIITNLFVGRGKATAAIDAARARTSLLATIRKEEDSLAAQRGDYIPRPLSPVEKANTEASEKQQKIVKDRIYTTPTPTPSEDATWLEKAVSEV